MPEKTYRLPLLRHYPQLEEKIPRISLGAFPTPVHPLRHLGYENLWIKRDDRSSPVYGGNKIRKLEFILAEARQRKTRHLITIGGIGTNHGLATAIFCDKLGIECTLLLYWQPVTANVKQNLLLFKKYNAQTVYKKTLWRTVLCYYLLYRIKHPGACFVFAGGSNPAGTIGFVNAAFELKEQVDRGDMPEPAVIICPLGSGGTLAGLSLGVQLAGLKTRVTGVRVTESHLGPFQTCTKSTVEKLIRQTYRYLTKRSASIPAITISVPEILEEFFGNGYGVPTQDGATAYCAVKEKENIILDPTYTAKTFAAVMEYCRMHQGDQNPVLYWHTYNSLDLSAQADSVDRRGLPEPLQRFLKQE